MNGLVLWVAQGFGVGRVPVAPGTFGSVVGGWWFFLLLLPGRPWFFVAGMLGSVFVSVWLCGAAEKILRQTDPGSVVLDEIIALPFCFAGWVAWEWVRLGRWPAVGEFLHGRQLAITVAIFVAFRVFDIAKPWPVRQSQALPGGWGVTVDDLLAALYVNFVTAIFLAVETLWS